MWYLTERKNGKLVRTQRFEFVDIEKAVRLYEAIGYQRDEVFTVPEWGRYYLDRNDNGEQESVVLEEVEE